ncbi:hypothetical protein [Gordonia rubripertincta]|uniref:hypothetical protein n=1 Tax=Gordonia rubripertincta TaxID=36822 RepID=UPI0015FC2FC4|nr:hypothetical protein [Gordonia rubripertincta]QMU19036.1 hypothetical protein H3V45_13040 [Gordonia rubripertincta]
MTAPAIHPDAIDAALPDFDAVVACDIEFLCTKGHRHRCDNPAVWRVRAHGYRSAQDPMCSTHTVIMCDEHLTELREMFEADLRDSHGGLVCDGCRRPLRQVSDLLLSVVAL